MVELALVARREPRRDRACAVLRLGAEEPRRADADARAGRRRRCARSRSCARAITAASSSTRWCRTTTRAFRSPASAAGAAARSMSRRPARCCPATPPKSIPGLEFWNVREHSLADIWRNSPAFNAFRGTAWMQEPCRSCARREQDFGGCRCQAFLLTGDARATDPVCHLSPHHALVGATRGDARRLSPTATGVLSTSEFAAPRLQPSGRNGEDLARRGRAPGPFSSWTTRVQSPPP